VFAQSKKLRMLLEKMNKLTKCAIALLMIFTCTSVNADSVTATFALINHHYNDALQDCEAAARKGDAECKDVLGVMYSHGYGVPKSYAEAAKWFRQGADQGYYGAQYDLGTLYAFGEGVPKDYLEAATWFRKAADQGDDKAQYNLGVMYENGQGVPQDYAEAVKWYRKAADQGNANAQNNLGIAYENGLGVTQSKVIAYALYKLSATVDPSDSNPAMANSERISQVMTELEKKQGQILMSEMSKPGHFLQALDYHVKTSMTNQF
jgi:TPR repeat protein